jgi:hypothetical protein
MMAVAYKMLYRWHSYRLNAIQNDVRDLDFQYVDLNALYLASFVVIVVVVGLSI